MSTLSLQSDRATLATSEAWQVQLVDIVAKGGDLALDLSTTDEMDLAGLQLVLATARAVADAGQAFALAPQPSPAVLKAFERAGLDAATWGPAGPALEPKS